MLRCLEDDKLMRAEIVQDDHLLKRTLRDLHDFINGDFWNFVTWKITSDTNA